MNNRIQLIDKFYIDTSTHSCRDVCSCIDHMRTKPNCISCNISGFICMEIKFLLRKQHQLIFKAILNGINQ